jgi:hypothetical protein
MDPNQILEQVNAFYSTAFSQLVTITLIILGFGGVVLPLILQNMQIRSFRVERDNLKVQIKTEIEKEIKYKLEQESKKVIQQNAQELSGLFDSVERRLNRYDLDLINLKINTSVKEEAYEHVVGYACEMINISKKLSWKYGITDALDYIQSALEKGALVNASLTREVTDAINSLPPEHTMSVQRIQKLISNIKI